VRCDPHRLSDTELERLIRRYASELHAILGEDGDIPAPDIAIGERELAWFREATGAEPVSLDSSRGRRDAGGLGAMFTLEAALEYIRAPLDGLRVVLQGFGSVGSVLARELALRGARIVGVCDVTGGIVNERGLDLDRLAVYLGEHRFLRGYTGGEAVTRTEILEVPCDVLVPAALEQQITERNAERIACRIVLEAAGCATTMEADAILASRGVRVVPDVLAGAGGMIASYFAWVQDQQKFLWDPDDVAERLRRQLRAAFATVIAASERLEVDWRTGAHAVALQRVADAARLRTGV
jgi:glutamate dehydrogenase (NAD(P)+)